MSAAEHTPGPWLWDEDYHGLFGAGPDNAVLTWYAYEGMHLSYGDRREANARLIAAAPDLLTAAVCEAALDLPFKQGGPIIASHGWVNDGNLSATEFVAHMRRAAIAKATGEQA